MIIHGKSHWIWQRVNAVIMLPLLLWMMFSVATLDIFSSNTLLLWLQNPLNGILTCLLLFSTASHFRLGFQMIIEDYVSDGSLRNKIIYLNIIFNFKAESIGRKEAQLLIKSEIKIMNRNFSYLKLKDTKLVSDSKFKINGNKNRL